MPGTNLAAIQTPERVIVFWQDREGWVCCRRAENGVWDEAAVRLCKAVDGTGIGATSWNGRPFRLLYVKPAADIFYATLQISSTSGFIIKMSITSFVNSEAVSIQLGISAPSIFIFFFVR